MNQGFVSCNEDGSWIQCTELIDRGVEHGFLGGCYTFSEASFLADCQHLKESLGVSDLLFLNQIHKAGVEEPSISSLAPYTSAKWCTELGYRVFPQGDAFVYRQTVPERGSKRRLESSYALCIRTADCAPVILKGDRGIAVVHAGWRGVAARILTEALAKVRSNTDSDVCCAIGPLAGEHQYEVGPEVIEAIGEPAVYTEVSGSDRCMLSISQSIKRQLLGEVPPGLLSFFDSEICTMTSSSYHSYRKNGGLAGRNISYVVGDFRKEN